MPSLAGIALTPVIAVIDTITICIGIVPWVGFGTRFVYWLLS